MRVATACPRARGLLVMVAVALAAGCGGGGEDDRTFTRDEVVRHVYERGGVQLMRSAGSSASADILVLPHELYDLYGGFELYVFDPKGLERNLEKLFGDVEPDERGIYWVREQNAGWLAHKRYGSNLVFSWFDAPRKGQLSPKWRRLDALLSSIPEPR